MATRIGRGLQQLVGAEVREGEWRLVFLFFVNLFLLLTAYYILKVVREPLILMGGGAVKRAYARGMQAGVLALIVPAYSLIANRVEPSRLVKWVLAFFVVTLAAFFVAGHAGAGAYLGFAFFVWLGIFSTLSIAQFWSLANDLLSEEDGRRLFPLVAAGGTAGGIVGAQVAARALRWLDPYQLMLLAAAVLSLCILLTHLTRGHGLIRRPAPRTEAPPRDARGGFSLILRDHYLLLIAGAVLLLNVINTTGDFILAGLVNEKAHAIQDAAARRLFIGQFYGNYQTWVSVLTAVIQILLVGRLFRSMGVGRALFLLPMLSLMGYGAAAIIPGMLLMGTVKVVQDSTEYSLQNTIQQALFLRTSRDSKYKAKAAIDTFIVRAGDLGSMAVVAAGVHVGLSSAGFAITNVVVALAWLWIVWRLARYVRSPRPVPASVARATLSA